MTPPPCDDDVTGVFHAAPPPQPRHDRPPTPPPPPRPAAGTPLPGQLPAQPRAADSVAVLSLVRRVALQSDLGSTIEVLERGVAELVGATRVQMLTSDPLTGMPWAAGVGETSLAALAASHQRQLTAQPAVRCPLWCPEVDDPDGGGDEAIIAQPIAAAGAVVAVLSAVRDPRLPRYTEREAMLLATVAAQIGPLLVTAIHAAAQRRVAAPQNPLFRDQALERHRESRRDGALLVISPRWQSRVYPAILVGFFAALAFGLFASVNQYSSGPAVIKIEGIEVTARAGGTVVATHVEPGQRVEAGDLLVELHSDAEAAELAELDLEYQRQLATFLFDPSNREVQSNLSTIAARRHKAVKVLESRAVRAPRAGQVSDLRVTRGKRLEAGDYIAKISEDGAAPAIIALLPGHDSPRLRPGMVLQFKLPGYEKTNERAVIDSVGREVIGPNEARRFVGSQIADAMAIKGPVVIVRARLEARTFRARDKTYPFKDGMAAKAEVSVRERRVLVALLPALEKYLPF